MLIFGQQAGLGDEQQHTPVTTMGEAQQLFRSLVDRGFSEDAAAQTVQNYSGFRPSAGLGDDFMRGVRRGHASGVGGLISLGQEITDDPNFMAGKADELRQRLEAPENQPVVDWQNIGEDDNGMNLAQEVMSYVASTAGSSLPETALAAGAGIAGAAVGGPVGGIAAGMGVMTPVFGGHNIEAQKEAGQEVNISKALGVGAAQAALDQVLPQVLARRLGVTGPINDAIAKKLSENTGSVIAKTGRRIGGDALVEALTETGQTVLEQAQADPEYARVVLAPRDETEQAQSDAYFTELIGSAIGGATLGGVMSTPGAVVEGYREGAAVRAHTRRVDAAEEDRKRQEAADIAEAEAADLRREAAGLGDDATRADSVFGPELGQTVEDLPDDMFGPIVGDVSYTLPRDAMVLPQTEEDYRQLRATQAADQLVADNVDAEGQSLPNAIQALERRALREYNMLNAARRAKAEARDSGDLMGELEASAEIGEREAQYNEVSGRANELRQKLGLHPRDVRFTSRENAGLLDPGVPTHIEMAAQNVADAAMDYPRLAEDAQGAFGEMMRIVEENAPLARPVEAFETPDVESIVEPVTTEDVVEETAETVEDIAETVEDTTETVEEIAETVEPRDAKTRAAETKSAISVDKPKRADFARLKETIATEYADRSDVERDAIIEADTAAALREDIKERRAAGATPEEIFDSTAATYKAMVKPKIRNSDVTENQQYSTPPPLAYAVGEALGVTEDTVVYDPTAGTGMLTIAAENPENVQGVELAANRAPITQEHLPNVLQEDALGTKPPGFDVLLTNPPFGNPSKEAIAPIDRAPPGKPVAKWRHPSGEMRDERPTVSFQSLDHAIPWKALNAMPDEGKAALIVAGPNPQKDPANNYDTGETKEFFDLLNRYYNVRSHNTVAGKLYRGMGANWPVDVILIDGRRDTPLDAGTETSAPTGDNLPPVLNTWEEVKDALLVAERTGGTVGAEATRDDGAVPDDAVGKDRDAGQGGTEIRDREGTDEGGEQPDRSTVPGGDDTGTDRDSGERPGGDGSPDDAGAETTAGGSGPRDDGGTGAGRGSAGTFLRNVSKARQDRAAELRKRMLDRAKTQTSMGVDPEQLADGIELGTIYLEAGVRNFAEWAKQLLADFAAADPEAAENLRPALKPIYGAIRESDATADEIANDMDPSLRGVDVPTIEEALAYAAGEETAVTEETVEETATEEVAEETVEEPATEDVAEETAEEVAEESPVLAEAREIMSEMDELGMDTAYIEGRIDNFDTNPFSDVDLETFRRGVREERTRQEAETKDEEPEITTPANEVEGEGEVDEMADGTEQPDATPQQKEQQAAEPQVTENQEVKYIPASTKARRLGTLMPSTMAGPTKQALATLRQKHGGKVDQYVADEIGYESTEELAKYLGAEQVDSVALGIDALKAGEGLVIGDQTGIGKGRQVAAFLRYARRQGKIPVFVTEKKGLYGDMMRDLLAIGVDDAKPMVTNNAFELPYGPEGGESIGTLTSVAKKPSETRRGILAAAKDWDNSGYDMVFTTYTQFDQERFGARDVMREIAPNAYFILDESHTAGGVGVDEVQREREAIREGKQYAVARETFVREIVNSSAGAIFSSATWAKRPQSMSLYLPKTGMGRLFGSAADLGKVFEKGGVALQQAASSMLARAGQYIRRERSFAGVEWQEPEFTVETAKVNQIAQGLGDILDFDQNYAAKARDKFKEEHTNIVDGVNTGQDVSSVSFAGIMHNLLDQLYVSAKADRIADAAIEAIEAGEKPVIAIANTGESMLQEFKDETQTKPGEVLDYTAASLMKRYLKRTLRVKVKEAGAPKDTAEYHFIPEHELEPEAQERYAEIEAYLDNVLQDAPGSPIDWIEDRIRRAGYSVGEITGRGTKVDYSNPETPVLATRTASEQSAAGKAAAIAKFNGGGVLAPYATEDRLDAMVLNQSGAVGVSLHASAFFGDKRRRRMIIGQAEKNIDIFVQMLGRVHRTGQVIPPIFVLPASNVPAENRLLAVLKKKLISLQANVSATGKGQVDVNKVPDFMNAIGGEVLHAQLSENPKAVAAMGLQAHMANMEGDSADPEAFVAKATARVAAMPLDMQQQFYDGFMEAYVDEVKQRRAMGQQIGAMQVMPLNAVGLKRQEFLPADGQTPFEAPVYSYEIDAAILSKPASPDGIVEAVRRSTGIEEPTTSRYETVDDTDAMQKSMRRGNQYMTDFLKTANADADAEIAVIPDDTIKEMANARKDALLNDLRQVTPGHPFKGYVGGKEVHGFVLGVTRPGKGLAYHRGSYRVEMALADLDAPVLKSTMAAIVVNPDVAKLASNKIGMDPINGLYSKYETADAVKAFEELAAQAETGTQKRVVLLGNVPRAYMEAQQGVITQMTDHTGTIGEGILLPSDITTLEEATALQNRVGNGAEAIAFMKHAAKPAGVRFADRVFVQGNGRDGKLQSYVFNVPATRGFAKWKSKKIVDIANPGVGKDEVRPYQFEKDWRDQWAMTIPATEENELRVEALIDTWLTMAEAEDVELFGSDADATIRRVKGLPETGATEDVDPGAPLFSVDDEALEDINEFVEPEPETKEEYEANEEAAEIDRDPEQPVSPPVTAPGGLSQEEQTDAASTATQQQTERDKIDDAGVAIGGSRKDMAEGGLKTSDLDEMTDAEQRRAVTRDRVWNIVKGDQKTRMADGENPVLVAMEEVFRSYIPTKPASDPYEMAYDFAGSDAEWRAMYVDAVSKVRDAWTSVETFADVPEAVRGGLRAVNERGEDGRELEWALRKLRGRKRIYFLDDFSYSVFNDPDADIVERLASRAAFKYLSGWPDKRAPWADTFERFMQRNGTLPMPDKSKKRAPKDYSSFLKAMGGGEMLIRYRDGEILLTVAKRTWNRDTKEYDVENIIEPTTDIAEFRDALVDAWGGLEENADLYQQYLDGEADADSGETEIDPWKVRYLEDVNRVGENVRNGRDVSPDDFIDKYGFRAAEFGKWNNQDERQVVVNHAYDAFSDLAAALGVKPKALSMGGKLAVGFGSRGRGGFAAAHYEPDRIVINMTKLNGAGSLAHEWFHGFANYIGSWARDGAGGREALSKSYRGYPTRPVDAKVISDTPEVVKTAVNRVLENFYTQEPSNARQIMDLEQDIERYKKEIAETRQYIENWRQSSATQKSKNSAIAQNSQYIARQERYIDQAFSRLEKLKAGEDVPASRKVTRFYEAAVAKSGNKGYWARPEEMWARAGEAYVHYKLKQAGIESPYLVTLPHPDGYPNEEEMPAIAKAFDNLLSVLQDPDVQETGRAAEADPDLVKAEEAYTAAAEALKEAPKDKALQSAERKAWAAVTAERAKRVTAYMYQRPDERTGVSMPHTPAIAELSRDLEDMGMDDVSVTIGADLRDMAGDPVWGQYLDSMIEVSTQSPDMLRTFGHEAMEAAYALGFVSESDAKILDDWGSKNLDKYRIKDRYQNASERTQIKEAVAEGFADYYRGTKTGDVAVDGVLRRLRRVFDRFRNWMKGYGFRNASDIFVELRSGALGRDPAQRIKYEETFARVAPVGSPDFMAAPGQTTLRRTVDSAVHALWRGENRRTLVREATKWERIKRLRLRKFEQKYVNKQSMLMRKEMDAWGETLPGNSSASKLSQMATQNQGRYDVMMFHGPLRIGRGDNIEVRENIGGLMEIFAPIQDDRGAYHAWAKFAIARRLKYMMDTRETTVEKLMGKDSVWAEDDYLDNALADTTYTRDDGVEIDLEEIADNYVRFNDQMIEFLVDTGVIRKEFAKVYKEGGVYVPFYRHDPETDEHVIMGPNEMRKALSNPSAQIKALHGSEHMVDDLLENITRNALVAAAAGAKNRAMAKNKELLVDTLGEFEVVKPARATKHLPAVTLGDQAVSYYEEGQQVHFRPKERIAGETAQEREVRLVEAQMLHEAMAAIGPEQSNALLDFASTVSDIYRNTITLAPPFILANWLRGSAAGYVQTHGSGMAGATAPWKSAGYLAKNTATALRAQFNEAMKSTPEEMAIKAATGMGGYRWGSPRDLFRTDMGRELNVRGQTRAGRFFAKMFARAERVGEHSEMADRVAIYRSLKAQGVIESEAAYQAQNLVDYGRHGSSRALRMVTRMVPFMNARIQGLARMLETQKTGAERAKVLRGVAFRGGVLAGIATSAALLRSLMGDDEEYLNEPLERRMNYLIFYVGNRKILLPKPFEYGAVFMTLPELAYGALVSGSEGRQQVIPGLKHTINATFALNPVPQFMKPALEVWVNKDMFRDQPLENLALQRLRPEERIRYDTSRVAIGAGKALGVSPVKVQHLIEGYTGVLGAIVAGGIDSITALAPGAPTPAGNAFGSIPVLSDVAGSTLGRFMKIREGDPASQAVNDFYEYRKNAEQLVATIKDLSLRGDIKRAQRLAAKNPELLANRSMINRMSRVLSDLNREIKRVRKDTVMTRSQKAKALEHLYSRKKELTSLMTRKVRADATAMAAE